MAKCKFCGNYVADEVYAMNNGMCDLCLRSANGEDDPIVVNQREEISEAMREQMWQERLAAETESKKFHSNEFENKSIREYRFPSYISSEIVDCADSVTGQALLLTTHQPTTTLDIVVSVVVSVFLLPFVAAGVFITGYSIYSIANWLAGGMTGNVGEGIGMFLFACVWDTFISFFVYGLILRRLYIFDWVLLKDNCLECYTGHRFNAKKAKRYEFRDIDVHLVEKSGNKSYSYWIEFSDHSSGSGLFRKCFKMSVDMRNEVEYWESFLKWYIQSKGYADNSVSTF